MKANFKKSLNLTLRYEGGLADDPRDPGGRTYKGVTQKVYDSYRIAKGLDARDVAEMSQAELQDIYYKNYWTQANCDALPDGVDLAVFDYAVNSGVNRAVCDLQRGLGCVVDGVAGMGTVAAAVGHDAESVVADVCARRLRFLRSLKTWKFYGKGWTARVATMELQAKALAREGAVQVPPVEEAVAASAAAKAPEKEQAGLKTAQGAGLTTSGAGAAGQTLMQTADQVKPHFSETLWGRLAIALFISMIVIGGALLAYSYIRRIKEAGGLGGFIGSIGQ